MLSFTEHSLDQQLLNASEELQEGIISTVLSKLDPSSKEHITSVIKKAKSSTDPKELERLGSHPHFAVRLGVVRNPNTSEKTLQKLKADSKEYKTVQKFAKDRLEPVTA